MRWCGCAKRASCDDDLPGTDMKKPHRHPPHQPPQPHAPAAAPGPYIRQCLLAGLWGMVATIYALIIVANLAKEGTTDAATVAILAVPVVATGWHAAAARALQRRRPVPFVVRMGPELAAGVLIVVGLVRSWL
jgi:hypothetical protein